MIDRKTLVEVSKTSLSTTFGLVVRARRDAAGLTQEELAEKAGLHPTYISLVERGKRNPSLDVAARIAAALTVTLTELISEAEHPSPQKLKTQSGGKRR